MLGVPRGSAAQPLCNGDRVGVRSGVDVRDDGSDERRVGVGPNAGDDDGVEASASAGASSSSSSSVLSHSPHPSG